MAGPCARCSKPITDFQVCGEASDGRDAIFKIQELHPDLVILDMAMPVMNDIEAARILSSMMPQVLLILLTAHDLAFFEPKPGPPASMLFFPKLKPEPG